MTFDNMLEKQRHRYGFNVINTIGNWEGLYIMIISRDKKIFTLTSQL